MAHPQEKAVGSLLYRLAKQFNLLYVFDGEEYEKAYTKKEFREIILSVDESILYVKNKETHRKSAIEIILGNDNWELISDYTVGDPILENVLNEFSEYWETR